MARSTHYGDEDPKWSEPAANSPEEHELFETAKFMGWTPESMRDAACAARYQEWLARQPK